MGVGFRTEYLDQLCRPEHQRYRRTGDYYQTCRLSKWISVRRQARLNPVLSPVNEPQPEWKAKTGADGTVEFQLPKPPTLFRVFPGTGNDLYPCSDMVFNAIDLDRVISEGVVSRCSKKTQGCRCKFGKALGDIHTRPRELVILTRPITVGEKIRWSIWQD